MEVLIIRHGKTEGNERRLYIGKTDQPLSAQGAQQLQEAADARAFPPARRVFVSPLERARQSAAILFPQAEHVVVPAFREMDFGQFEGRSADDMEDDPAFRAWVDADCRPACPEGESRDDFEARVKPAFAALVAEALEKGEERLVIVAHGGVTMTVMGGWASPRLPYYQWWAPNGGGYRIQVDQASWEKGAFASWESVGREHWVNRAYSFFQNTACEYFPCHAVDYPEEFNCLFCFCPFYHLGKACPGTPAFNDEGVKDCTPCTFPHHRDSYGQVTARLRKPAS
ncbi:MAG: histidine phosphatase family protein [Eggerthellaceae bacterium]|nr:histidine phosphatase family protein [Eggerthellaceae bacterium]